MIVRKMVVTLKLSGDDFEQLFGEKLDSVHQRALQRNRGIVLKTLTRDDKELCTVEYNPFWQDFKVEPKLSQEQQLGNYFYNLFGFVRQPVIEPIFCKVHFVMRNLRDRVETFLTWFKRFAKKRHIKLFVDGKARAIFANPRLSSKQLEELSCVQIHDFDKTETVDDKNKPTYYAIVYNPSAVLRSLNHGKEDQEVKEERKLGRRGRYSGTGRRTR